MASGIVEKELSRHTRWIGFSIGALCFCSEAILYARIEQVLDG